MYTTIISFMLPAIACANTINVPADHATIQAAIDAAVNGDEIIVAPGTYTSTQDGHVIDMQGKAVTLRASGTPAETIIDGQNTRRGIACFNGETDATIIDGFTITNGLGVHYDYNRNDVMNFWEDSCGGILCYASSSPTITNCTITGNMASNGAGIFCYFSCNPTIINCTITDNNTNDEEDIGGGGGIYCSVSAPTITNCRLSGNTTGGSGGGIFLDTSHPTITDCTISSNTAFYNGGGIFSYSSNSTINNCTMLNNMVGFEGGGMFIKHSTPTLKNSTFSGNTSGFMGGGICLSESSNSIILNCTISDNTAVRGGGISSRTGSNSTITGCTITSNTADEGGGILLQGTTILTGSLACGNIPSQIIGSWNDNGGNTVEDKCPECLGDATGDGSVDVNDVLYLISAWDTADPNADFDEDGLVDADDVLILLSHLRRKLSLGTQPLHQALTTAAPAETLSGLFLPFEIHTLDFDVVSDMMKASDLTT